MMAIKGLIITFTDEEGPKVAVNFSELNEILSSKLAIIGMTLFMLGNESADFFTNRYYKVIGLIPLPSDDSISDIKNTDDNAIGILFNVKADSISNDNRIRMFGKDVIAWLIFEQFNREKIFNSLKKIEAKAFSFLKKIEFESQLYQKDYFLKFLEEIQAID